MTKRVPVGPFPHFYAIVDDEDYEIVSQYQWRSRIDRGDLGRVYALTGGAYDHVSMHLLLTGFEETDHINGIGLDNRRCNLRPSNGRNQQNQKKHKTYANSPTSSTFKGVSWNKHAARWSASICPQGKKIHLGYFDDQEDAARAYDAKALELFGDFARPNFPGDTNG